MIGMGKDMGSKYARSQDALRLFNRALELLANLASENEQELLELAKKAKRDADKYHPHALIAVNKPSHQYYCFFFGSFLLLFPKFFCVFGPFVDRRLYNMKLLGSI
jgi:hypothetical protein